jgi:hypothetical protein
MFEDFTGSHLSLFADVLHSTLLTRSADIASVVAIGATGQLVAGILRGLSLFLKSDTDGLVDAA